MSASHHPITCPMCNPKLPRNYNNGLPNVNFSDYKVTIPSTNEQISFDEATSGYIRTHFHDLETTTHKVPSIFCYKQDERLDFALDDEVARLSVKAMKGFQKQKTPSAILTDRRQKEAVEVIANEITLWGRKCAEPMFVISEFPFASFLVHVDLESCSDEETMDIERREVSMYDGDHDIIVILLNRGLVFIQVKGVSASSAMKTRRQQLEKAITQLIKDKLAIKGMNRDYSFVHDLPMLALVGVPNLSDQQLNDVGVCKLHRDITISRSLFETEGLFYQWWNDKLVDLLPEGKHVMNIVDYQKLCGRYVGLASSVSYRILADAVKQTGRRIGRLLLTPTQKSAVSADPRIQRNIILGDFGTGKSLLLIKMAEQLATDGDFVYVLSFSVVSDGSGKVQDQFDNCVKFLQGFVTCDARVGCKIVIRSFLDHLKFIGYCESLHFPKQPLTFPFQLTPSLLCEIMHYTIIKYHTASDRVHFFFDELPLCLGKCDGGWDAFESFCREANNTMVWLSISCCSYALTMNDNFSCIDKYLPASFDKTILYRCMRVTRNGFKLVQAIRKFKGDGHYNLSICGNIIDGPVPVWYELPLCFCNEVTSPYTCHCVAKGRMKNALDAVMKRLAGIKLEEVTIILHDTSSKMTNFLAKVVEEACQVLQIECISKVSGRDVSTHRPLDKVGVVQNHVTLVDFWSYKGNESKVVIYIDPYGGPVVWNVQSLWYGYQDVAGTLSRSLAQIFYITWPLNEQQTFLLDLAETMEATGRAIEDQLGKDFQFGVARGIRKGRIGHMGQSKNFMNYLVSEKVIVKF